MISIDQRGWNEDEDKVEEGENMAMSKLVLSYLVSFMILITNSHHCFILSGLG
jgi:hypothetical protein